MASTPAWAAPRKIRWPRTVAGVRVLLLGTGPAAGWPDAFCDCARCTGALRRGLVRRPTSVLVDDAVLLDLGAETAGAALRAGRSLAQVGAVLQAHGDGNDPGALRAGCVSRAGDRPAPMVVGSASTLDRWRTPTEPGSPRVRLVEAAAGDRLEVGSAAGVYDVEVVGTEYGGRPGGGGLGYLLTAPDGSRLLYATDPLSEPTGAALGGRRLDVALLAAGGEQVTADGEQPVRDPFGDQLGWLRASGAVDDRTEVVAVRLSHHHPPDEDDRLAATRARAGHDLETVAVGADRVSGATGHRTLVLGGARSGKSSTAERLVAGLGAGSATGQDPGTGPVTYVATGPPAATDTEWAERVRLHRERRPPSWHTVETTDVAGVLSTATGPVLVDCLTLWLTAVLDAAGAWEARPGWRDHLDRELTRLADAWTAATVPVVAVSNEVGAGVVPPTAAGRLFRDEQGRLNTRLATTADRCLLVVAGRALELPP